jgi:hypothetical protein
MLEFGNDIYYIDLDAFDKNITIQNTTGLTNINLPEKEVKTTLNEKGEILLKETYERSIQSGKEIDMAKYDLLKTFIEYIIDYPELEDDVLGSDRILDKATFGFKIVFNTLLNQKILVKTEQ